MSIPSAKNDPECSASCASSDSEESLDEERMINLPCRRLLRIFQLNLSIHYSTHLHQCTKAITFFLNEVVQYITVGVI